MAGRRGGRGWLAAFVAFAMTAAAPADERDRGDWPMGGHDAANGRNQPITRLRPGNVGRLKPKWVFTTGGDVSATPAVARGTVYFPDFAGNVFAVDAATGKLVWTRTLASWTGVAGDFSRDDPLVYDKMVILGDQAGTLASWTAATGLQGAGARLVAADAETGALIWSTVVEPFPAAVVTSSPVAFDGLIYVGVASAEEALAGASAYPCCVSRGSVVALDARTGKVVWRTYMTPDNQGRPGGYSGGGVWGSTPAVFPRRGLVVVGTGNNYSVPASVEKCAAAKPADRACTDPADYFDAVVALDLKTGKLRWADRAMIYDAWNVGCFFGPAGVGNCPEPAGMDDDFGAGPNLFKDRRGRDLIGIGEKSGTYYALDAESGALAWTAKVGPGSQMGGVEWGTAADRDRIYVPIADAYGQSYALRPSGLVADGGSWAALDPATGAFLWQVATPGRCPVSGAAPGVYQNCLALGAVSAANGVLFAGSMDTNPNDPTMFALDGATGRVFWSFAAGSSVLGAPAITGDSVYWGAGYRHFGPSIGTGNNKLFAFSIGEGD